MSGNKTCAQLAVELEAFRNTLNFAAHHDLAALCRAAARRLSEVALERREAPSLATDRSTVYFPAPPRPVQYASRRLKLEEAVTYNREGVIVRDLEPGEARAFDRGDGEIWIVRRQDA